MYMLLDTARDQRIYDRLTEFGGSVQARLVLLRLFEDGMPEAAAESYQKVNDLLVANQILPKIKYGITKSKSDPSKRAAAAEKAVGGEKEKGGAAAPAVRAA